MKTIWVNGIYRITEEYDLRYSMQDLKGECFDPRLNEGVPLERLKKDELDFERYVERHGVYGYTLEQWNPEIGQGWEHVDSCWGFVGQYSDSNQHYIVDEMKDMIKSKHPIES